MRALVIVALALFLAGATTASSGGSPLSLGSFSEINGSVALGGSSAGQRVRFLPNQRFAAGIVLENTSRTSLVVSRVDVLEPPRALIHQTGARFVPFRSGCSGGRSCPAPAFGIGSGIAHRPHPFTLAARKQLGVELDFRIGSCADVPGASSAPLSRLRVTFHGRGGAIQQRVLALGYDSLRVRMPKPEDCMFPRSTLYVNDPGHIGTSYLFTVPGSKGDVCTHTGRALTFRSRALENNDRRPEWIEIRFPHFAGNGTYRRAIATVVVGQRTAFRSTALVDVTMATTREVDARVLAGRLRPQAATVPYRIYGWMRCSVVQR